MNLTTFTTLKRQRDDIVDRKMRLLSQLEVYKKQITEIDQKLLDLGVEPSKLEEVIKEKEEKLKLEISAFSDLLSEKDNELLRIEDSIAKL